MQVRASTRNLRMSPRKVRLVIDTIRGLPAGQALAQLQFDPHTAAREVWKTVRSAVANAENNYGLDPDNLVIVTATADQGPSLPMRFRAKARGMAGPVEKKTTHITIVVDDEAAPRRRK
jgi:large subunit ribosomal protein L22